MGSRDGWEAFLRTFAEGFYADLAKGQLKKIAAEEARAAAVEKARLAEGEKARLAAEGAKQTDQARAAAAAEEARNAAEKVKQAEQDKAAAAEKNRIAEQEKARLTAEKAKPEQDKAAAAEQARLAAPQADDEKKQQLAALPTAADKSDQSPVDLPKTLQAELRRVGCNTGSVDGNLDALDAVKSKTARICPLICGHGYRADGERCTRITCRRGFEVGDDDTCEKIETKKLKPEEPKVQRDRPEQAKTAAELTKQFNNDPTCSSIRAVCDKSPRTGHCASSFAQCMQTGRWKSGVSNSQYEGLSRR